MNFIIKICQTVASISKYEPSMFLLDLDYLFLACLLSSGPTVRQRYGKILNKKGIYRVGMTEFSMQKLEQ